MHHLLGAGKPRGRAIDSFWPLSAHVPYALHLAMDGETWPYNVPVVPWTFDTRIIGVRFVESQWSCGTCDD